MARRLSGDDRGLVADSLWKPPVIASAIVFALAIEAYRESTGGGRFHYVAAGTPCSRSLFPLFGLIAPGKEAVATVIGVMGFIYVIGGLLDHRELVHILATSAEATDVRTV